jgi:hypothetical protein
MRLRPTAVGGLARMPECVERHTDTI